MNDQTARKTAIEFLANIIAGTVKGETDNQIVAAQLILMHTCQDNPFLGDTLNSSRANTNTSTEAFAA